MSDFDMSDWPGDAAKLRTAVLVYLNAITTAPGTVATQLALDQMAGRAGWRAGGPTVSSGADSGESRGSIAISQYSSLSSRGDTGWAQTMVGVMCATGDHTDVPAVGDAWGGDEDQPEQRAPYCAECLTTLGDDFEARWWKPVSVQEVTDGS